MATIQQQRELIALTTLMFDAPPGAEYLEELSQLVDNGLSLTAIANELINSPLFNGQFSTSETDRAKINQILENVGVSVNSPIYEEAYQFFADGLDNGLSPAAMLVEAGQFLATTTDPRYAEARATFENKIEVGVFHSIEVGRPSGSLEELQEIYAGVTNDTATIDQATGVVNTFRLAADGSNADLTEVELADNFTRIDLNGQNATLNAEQAALVILANGGSYSLADSAENLLSLPESVLNGATDIAVTGSTTVTQAVEFNALSNTGELSYTIEGSVNAIGTALRGDDSTDATREALTNADAIFVGGEITLNLAEFGLIGDALQTEYRIVDSADNILALNDDQWDAVISSELQDVVLNASPEEALSVEQAQTLEARVTDFASFSYDVSASLAQALNNSLWSGLTNVDTVTLNEELSDPLTMSQAVTLQARVTDFVNAVEYSITDTPANIQQALDQDSSAAGSVLANAESIVTNATGNVVSVNQIVGWLNAGANLETLEFDLRAGEGSLGTLNVSDAVLRLDIIEQSSNTDVIGSTYALSDSTENLLAQADTNADVLTSATSVAASDDAGMTQVKALLEAGLELGSNFTYSLSINPNRGDLDVETLTLEWDIIQAAQNTDDVLPVTYSITDTIDAILGLENTLLEGASTINVEGTATLAEIQTLRDAGISLDDLTFALEGGEQGKLTIGEAQAYQEIIAAASNDIELSGLPYTLADSVDNVRGELAGNVALLTGADAITLQGNATVEQIQSLLDAGIALDNLTFTLAGGDDLGELSLDGIADIQALNDQANNDVFDTLVYTLSDDIAGLVAAASDNTVALTQAAGITVEDDATVAQIQTLLDAGVVLNGDFNYSLADPEALGNLSIADAEKAQAIAGNADAGGITYAIVDSWSDINGFIQNGGDTTLLSEADNINVTDNVTRDNIATLLAENVDLDDITFTLGAGQGNLGSDQSVAAIQQALDIILQAKNTASVSLNFSLQDEYSNLLDAEGDLQQPLLASASAVTVTDAVTVENAGRLQAQFSDSNLTFDIADGADAIRDAEQGTVDAAENVTLVEAETVTYSVEQADTLLDRLTDTANLTLNLEDSADAIRDADEATIEVATDVTLEEAETVTYSVEQAETLLGRLTDTDNLTLNLEDTADAIRDADEATIEAATDVTLEEAETVTYSVNDAVTLLDRLTDAANLTLNLADGADAIRDADQATIDAANDVTLAEAETVTYSVEQAETLLERLTDTSNLTLNLADGADTIRDAEQGTVDALNEVTLAEAETVTYSVEQADTLLERLTDTANLTLNLEDSADTIRDAEQGTVDAAANVTLAEAETVTYSVEQANTLLARLTDTDNLTLNIEDSADAIRDADQATIDAANEVTLAEVETVTYSVADADTLLERLTDAANLTLNLEDNASNLTAADNTVLTAAEAIEVLGTARVSDIETLVDADVDLGDITFNLAAGEDALSTVSVEDANARLAIIDQSSNRELANATYALDDDFATLEGEIADNSALLANAGSITVEDAITRDNVETLTDVNGVDLSDLVFELAAGEQNFSDVSVGDAVDALAIIDASSNFTAAEASYSLDDSIVNLLGAIGQNTAVLTGANGITVSDDTVELPQIQQLVDAGVDIEDLTFTLEAEIYVLSVEDAEAALPIFEQDTGTEAGYRLVDTDVNLAASLTTSLDKRALLNDAEEDGGEPAITISNAATVNNVETIVTRTDYDPADVSYSLASGQQNLGNSLTVSTATLRLDILAQATNEDTLPAATYGLRDSFGNLNGTIQSGESSLLANATGDIVITGAGGSTTVSRENIETLIAVEGVELESLRYDLALGEDNLGTVSIAEALLALDILEQSSNNNAADARYSLEDGVDNFVTTQGDVTGTGTFDSDNYELAIERDLLDNANSIALTGEVTVGQVLVIADGRGGVELSDLTYSLATEPFVGMDDFNGSVLEVGQIMAVINQATNTNDIEFDYSLTDTAAELTSTEGLALVEDAVAIEVEGPATRPQIQELRDAGADLLNITYTLGAGQGNLIGELDGNNTIAEVRSALEVIQQADNSDSVTLRLSIEDTYDELFGALGTGNFENSGLPVLSILTRAEAISITDDVSVAQIQSLIDAENANNGPDREAGDDIALDLLDYSLNEVGDYDFPETGSFALAEAADSEELTILLSANNFGELEYTLAISDDRVNIFTEGEGNAFAEGAATLLNAATEVAIEHTGTQSITLAQYALFENLTTFDVANLTFGLEDTIAGAERFELDVASETFGGGVFEVTGSNYARFEAELTTAAGDDDITLNFADEVLANRFVISGDMGDGEDSLTLDIPNLTNEDDEAALEYTIANVEHLTLNFGDSDDTLVLTSNSVMELDSLTVDGGTLDATQADTFTVTGAGGTGIVLNSSLIVTEAQYIALVQSGVTFSSESDSISSVTITREGAANLTLSQDGVGGFQTGGTVVEGQIQEAQFDALPTFRVAEEVPFNTGTQAAVIFETDPTQLGDGDTLTVTLPDSALTLDGGTKQDGVLTLTGPFNIADLNDPSLFIDGGTAPELNGTFSVNASDQLVFTYDDVGNQTDLAQAELVVENVTTTTPTTDTTTDGEAGTEAVVIFETDPTQLGDGDTLTVTLPDSALTLDGGTKQDGVLTLTGPFNIADLNDPSLFIDGGTAPELNGTFSVNASDQLVFTYDDVGNQTDLAQAELVVENVTTTTPMTDTTTDGEAANNWSAVIELSGTGTDETDFQENQSYNFTLTLTEQGEGGTLETFTLLDTFQVGVTSLGNNIADQLATEINNGAFGDTFTASEVDGNLVIEAVDSETNYDVSTIFVEIA